MLLLFVYLALAIGVSFLCSILEAVLLSVTPSHVAVMEERGSRSGRLLRTLKRDIERPLSAILSLNTIAHTVGAAGVGAQAQTVFGNAYVSITSAVLTLLILVFSEIIPKTLGATHWKRLAGFTAHACRILIVIAWPLVALSKGITYWLNRGRPPTRLSREEFRAMARMGAEQGLFEEEESNIFHNLIRFSAIRVRDVMTPRVVMVKYQQDLRLSELSADIENTPFSRIPIYDESDEDITGYVLKSDIMLTLARDRDDTPLRELRRDVLFVPEMIPLRALLGQLLEKQEHLAVVVDEFGGLVGVVTMEDVVETLLGMEITDESDTIDDLRRHAREGWARRAQRLGLELPDTTELETDGTEKP